MKTPKQLKHLIKLIHCAVLEEELKYCLIVDDIWADITIKQRDPAAHQQRISRLKKLGREETFNLLISGISHREFMKFIEELGE